MKWDEDSVGSEIDVKQYSSKEKDSLNKGIEEFGLDLPTPTSEENAWHLDGYGWKKLIMMQKQVK